MAMCAAGLFLGSHLNVHRLSFTGAGDPSSVSIREMPYGVNKCVSFGLGDTQDSCRIVRRCEPSLNFDRFVPL